jgi:hypothetical protein
MGRRKGAGQGQGATIQRGGSQAQKSACGAAMVNGN